MQIQTHSLEEFKAEARRFAAGLSPLATGATVIALSGDLGAGKTTFTQEVAKAFGIEETVTSPTFVIEKVYDIPNPSQGFGRLVHIDAYRLNGAHDLDVLGWKEILAESNTLVLVEWPEKIETALEKGAIQVTLQESGDNRTITYGKK